MLPRRFGVVALVSVAVAGVLAWTAGGSPAPQAAPAPQAPAPAAAPAASTARIVGRVPVLARKPVSAIKDYGPPPAFKVDPPDPAASAVWVGSCSAARDPATAAPARIEQRGYQFRPALTVVQTGTPVIFPNEDQLYHSVFSKSPAKRFDLGRYRKGEEPAPVVFDVAGAVQLFCEVHEHMRANVLVVDTPWFAVTDAEGRFSIEGIAPGKHVVSVWLSPKQTVTREVELSAGQTLDVDWSDLAKGPTK
ncbi:MAG: carboxypeptidase regulatory-like domain-containing protein [Planctomycetota bacterium]